VACLAPAAWAQFNSAVVGFNDNPDVETSREMFRIPEFSGSTSAYIVANTGGTFTQNNAYRASGLLTEGTGAMRVFYRWVSASDPDGWLRLSTFGAAERPNPGLHLGGKVRFRIINQSELFRGNVGICIGVRETGELVPQLANGGTTGDIEWIGVSTTPNGITAGADGIVNTTAAGDDVQVHPLGTDINMLGLNSGTAVIAVGTNGVLDTAPAGDDQIRRGYKIGADGERVPIPAYTLPVNAVAKLLEWNLATGQISVNGANQGGGIAGMTGDGMLSAANNRGALEHIAFVNVTSDTAILIEVAIDELQFESPVPDPVVPPTVVAPIIDGDPTVTVTDLVASVNRVVLLRGGAPILTQDVVSNADVVFNLPANAMTGEVYTATQRDSITGNTSAESNPVTVLAEPSPFGMAIVLDEDGDGSCSFTPPGGWEFLGASNLATLAGGFLYPTGQPLFVNDSTWQTIEFSYDDPANTKAWLGGNAVVDPSPTGFRSIDSVWLNVAPGSTVGPHEVFFDAVEVLDETDTPIEVIHTFDAGVTYMTNIRGQSNTGAGSSGLSSLATVDGSSAHRVTFTYPDGVDDALGLYHNIGGACGTGPRFSDAGAKIRWHVLVRRPADPNDAPIPVVVGPVSGAQSSVRVNNDAAAGSIQIYVNGAAMGAPVPTTGTVTDVGGLALNDGDSVSATQFFGSEESRFAYPRVVYRPIAPTLQTPVAPGSMSVTVNGLYTAPFATASLVEVFLADGTPIGNAVPAGSSANVPLSVTLTTGQEIYARQTVNGSVGLNSSLALVAFEKPIIYAAPAEGDTSIRVQNLDPSATSVTLEVLAGGDPNSVSSFTTNFAAGQSAVNANVAGLLTGDVVRAFQTVGAINSEASADETVTVPSTTAVLCDDFEYDEAAYLANWANSGTNPRPTLDTGRNATVGGAKSILAPATTHRVEHGLANFSPSATNPVVLNVNIYDAFGPGATGTGSFAQLNGQVADFFFMHVGLSGPSLQPFLDGNYYQFRAVGNGGPDWINLNQLDAPTRTVGWHTFTVVHKGSAIDVYVDGLLSAKNIALSATTTFDFARIGGGVFNNVACSYDDYCIETGAVVFGEISPQPPVAPVIDAPILDGDMAVDVSGVAADVSLVEIVDGTSTVIGTFSDPIPPDGDVTVSLSRALVHLERITARVTNVVGSASSAAMEAGVGNGDVLVCIGVRETGDVGPLGSTGGTTGAIEWIRASGTVSGAPQGFAISPSNSWQPITFDPASHPITSFAGGNGAIDGTRGTLEHLAITINAGSANRSSGTYEIYVDNVVNVGAGAGGSDFVIEDFEFSLVGTEVLFQEPTNSGSTAGNLAPLPSASEVSSAEGNPGQSAMLVCFFKDTDASRWARITTSGTTERSRPIIDLTRPIRMDILLVESGAPPCVGDLDGDNVIGLGDLAIQLANFGTTSGAEYEDGDLDGDGDVDLADLAVLLAVYGTPCP